MDRVDNLIVLNEELEWLQTIIEHVIRSYLKQEGYEKSYLEIEPPNWEEKQSPYVDLVEKEELTVQERIAIALVIAPHLRPECLDLFFGKNKLLDRPFTEFGGATGERHNGFLPTIQTLYFLLGSTEKEELSTAVELIHADAFLRKEGIIQLGATEADIPSTNAVLNIGEEWLNYFIEGVKPEVFSRADFPAHKINTPMEWDDVVLNEHVMQQLNEISSWIKHGETLLHDWGLNKVLKAGYRALFYGPPGTGKTLTATLLGKSNEKEVYKVDLSMIVSKYIGETEKNLAKVFDIAQRKDWILFFDEADALFGKRTAASSSNDRFANQQTAYLLQRVENYPGMVILASNLKSNMDEAFTRRFQSMIHFPMPDVEERFRLWKNTFSMGCQLADEVDLYEIAENYEMAGGAIINVLRYCAIQAVQNENNIVNKSILIDGIKREFRKENKTLEVKI